MQIFYYFMQFNLHFFICCVRISWSFERGRDKMDDITVMQLADKYNDSLKKMIDPYKIEKNQNEDPVSVAKKIYNNNSIDPKKIDEYFNDDLKPSSLVIERIKNNSYYNILDKDSNKYSILYRVNGVRRKISITANSDGMIDYNELLKIKNIIGGPYIELSIEDLYLILYKLSKESLIDVDLTSLRTSIQVNRLNREFNDKSQEFKSLRKHLVKA